MCKETHLTALDKMDIGRDMLSVDGVIHGSETSAYRSANIV